MSLAILCLVFVFGRVPGTEGDGEVDQEVGALPVLPLRHPQRNSELA